MKIPVLIAGGGPVGLALAGDLGWRGIPCLLIERSDGTVRQPKMDLLHIRTLEFCRRWGIVPWVEAAGYNRDYSQDYAWVTGLVNGWELGREPFPPCSRETPPPQSPQHRERCPQNFFDPVLARFARSTANVTVRLQTELVSFEEHDNGVTAVIEDRTTGKRETVEADYLAGCDGASSKVRDALGIGMQGNPVLTNTTNAIFRFKGPGPRLEELHNIPPAYRYIFIGPEGTWATIVAINGRDEWRFSFVGDVDQRALNEEDMRAAIIKAVGRDFDFDIVSMMPWTRRELVADRFDSPRQTADRPPRVFIVGDSAHQLSPTGGFGMNTGIQEAVDISWKLAASIHGWGGPRLLSSYDIERRPVAQRNVSEASRNLKRMLTPRSQKPPREVFEPGPAGDAARRQYGDDYTEMMKPEWFTIGIQLGFRYEGSPVIVPDGTPAPPDEVSNYTQTARPGSRAPHVWLETGYSPGNPGRSTLDLFGKSFVLLRIASGNAALPDADAIIAAASQRGVPLEVVDLRHNEVARVYEQPLVLVRPDGHVAWRASSQPVNPTAALQIIDTVRGA